MGEQNEEYRKSPPILWIVIPCFNEEKVLNITAPLFRKELELMASKGLIQENSRILFIDDGSSDSTWEIITSLAESDSKYLGIRQSRNRGHQNALMAGMMEARQYADAVITADCDGQDDISAMEAMAAAYRMGSEIVYGVRKSRECDSFLKRETAQGFYRLLAWMGAETVYNHADYRLVSTVVLEELAKYKEVNLFLRGMFPLIGYNSTAVYYERKERLAGKTHYPLAKMAALAIDGVTSLSVKPLHLIAGFGMVVSVLSLLGIIWAFVGHMRGGTVTGWASTVCIICFLSGVQLISMGILGEYIGKIYLEVKARPRYSISERTWKEEERREKKSL